MEEPYYAMCDVSKKKMIKEEYEKLRYCDWKARPDKCSSCLFAARLHGIG